MAASSSSFNFAPTSYSRLCNYDVFLSFRGEDTRKTFVDHLYAALKHHMINIYKDDETLSQGESIGPCLFKAIEESRIAVIIFSKNYADSSWCLDELAYIMKCRVERGLIVMPIFYDVEPCEVRKQKGDFGKAFAKQETENFNKAELWRKVLIDVSNIAGWEPKRIANGHEAQAIKKIVDTIFRRLFPLESNADKDLVGMRSRLQHLESLLDIGSGGVCMVGIWGVGGSGKTTLATSIYTKISYHFQGRCIAGNVREESNKYDLKKLQENILSSVFRIEVKVHSVEEGKLKMKSMLCGRKVLVLIDDVDTLDQLDALAGSHDWFGSGSRIIITTRNEHLLRTREVDHVYHARLLSHDEAIQLFSRHAFKKKHMVKDYKTLSLRVVSYAAGLPLALKVLGSFLYNKEKKEWMSTLDRLKDIPETEIMEKLKISYNGLKTVEKDLFLDIACFWRRRSKDDAIKIFEACGYHPEIGINVLTQKALITIVAGKFDMHDLVHEMGQYIVREEHPKNPEKHSRVWKHEDIIEMCLWDTTMENNKTEAIIFDGKNHGNDISSRFCKIVSNMKKLRYLSVSTKDDDHDHDHDHSSHFFNIVLNMIKLMWLKLGMRDGKHNGWPNFLSNELRYIDWIGYPARSLPDSFQPTKLVVLKLSNSKQKEVWKGCKHLPHLKLLQLEFMWNLLSTPEFNVSSLQTLTLIKCSALKKIHPSLGNHTSLEYVRISSCPELKMFPTFAHMKNLKTLAIESCFLEDGEIPSDIGELSNLQELSLYCNDFSILDFSLSQLTSLKVLNLSYCVNLLELPQLPSNLAILKADYCKSLTTVGYRQRKCKRLCKVSLAGGGIINDGGKLIQFMLEGKSTENCSMLLVLEGVEVAKGFRPPLLRHRGGRSQILQLRENWCNDFSGFLFCVVLSSGVPTLHITMTCATSATSGMDSKDEVWKESLGGNYVTWVLYVPFTSMRCNTWWDQCKALSFRISEDSYCRGFGVRLIAKKSRYGLPETSKDSSDYTSYINTFLEIQHASVPTSALSISVDSL